MWHPTSPAGTLSRPRLAIVAVAAMAAVAVGYLTYEYRLGTSRGRGSPGRGLRRRNALRRARSPPDDGGGGSETSEETAGNDHVDIHLRGHERSSGNGNNIHDDDRVDTNNASVVATTSVDVDALIHAGSDGWWNNPTAYQPPTRRTGQNIVSLLFRVSEDRARRSSYVHRGCQCNICGAVPIRGIRYRCTNCADFDLCETCEAQGIHNRTHIFYKIKMPIPPYSSRHMQPVWYTGDPDNCRRSLPRSLIVKLSRETGMDLTEVEAFWEQWTFMAVSEWKDDPDEVGVAMDRKTFDRCLVPTGGSRYAAPNLIHDRMFAFYDTNNDGLITFSEFLHGLAYRKRKDKLRKIFDGYDIDNDGYVSRRDFLRMFRAYYVIYKQMHKDIVDLMDGQLRASTEAASLVYSRQPLSSFFGRDDNVPPSNARMQFQGKTFHADGTVHLDDAHRGATAENSGDTASREDILTRFFAYGTRQDPPHRGRAVEGDTSSIRHAVRLSFGSDADRAYWSTLLHPPATLDDLARALVGDRSQETGASDDDSDDEIQPGPGDDRRPQYQSNSTARPWRTESELQAKMLEDTRLKAAELERQRRAMARDELHTRWKKRMFYLDEEEGGQPPDDWNHDDDYLAKHYGATEKAHSASYSTAAPTRSRSSSKVRFAGDVDDCETRSNLPTSSRSVPERWGGMDIPDAEREAGKEILYQVTQQAFNELLDTIFKASEDLAYEAGMTKKLRDDAKAALDALEAEDRKEDEVQASPGCKAEGLSFGVGQPPETAKSGGSANLPDGTVQPESATDGDGPAQYRDLTMPQFRPNSIHSTRRSTLSDGDAPYPSQGISPPIATLRWWQVLAQAEATAEERNGWGRLSYDEFEVIYRFQERQGNRLDFLGSWIDFCIP